MKAYILLCVVALLSQVHTEALQLFSVSSSPTQVVPPSGSVSGGTTLYIKGLGFSTNANDNQVFVGSYPCVIPAAGATATSLACITSDSGQKGNIYYLPIIVTSNGQQQRLTNQQGSFSYLGSSTPYLLALYPASAVPGTYLNFYGIHRISYLGDGQRDMGNVLSMKIGDSQCSRFDIVQGPISANSGDTISCYHSKTQQAGKYQAIEQVTVGYSQPDYHLRRTSALNENYHFAVLPDVKSIAPSSGSIYGQRIVVSGAGFTTNKSNIEVSVDDTACDLVSSSVNQIICDLQPKNNSDSSQLPTNYMSQVKGYLSGNGLKYQRYDISGLSSKSPASLRSAISSSSSSISLLQQGYRADIKTGNYYGSNYGEAFSGYFYAPYDGTYTFQGIADDMFAVYLSANVYGSAQPASTPLIYSNSVQNDNFYLTYTSTAEANVTLQAGKHYYIEAYSINIGGAGFFRVAVSVPNNDTTLNWQTHTVQKLDLSFTNDPEIVEFRQTGGTAGIINMTIVTRVLGKPPSVEAAAIPFNASLSEFLTAIKSLSCFGPYGVTGTRTIYDANGVVTTNTSQAYTYAWTLNIALLRSTIHINTVITPQYTAWSGPKTFTQNILQPHGPLISGTFQLTINGNAIRNSGNSALSPSISPGNLQSAFRAIPGFENVQVDLMSNAGTQAYGATWIITYYGINSLLPDMQVNAAGLLGGKTGTTPQMTSLTLRYYSPRLLYDPIDYSLLHTASTQPNVLVTVNGMPSICTGDCRYTFLSNTPVVSSAQINNEKVTLSLTDPSSIGYTLNNVTISIADQPCNIINIADPISNFQCSLPQNPDTTPTVPQGSYMPQVNVDSVGKLPTQPSVYPFNFSLNLTSLNITSGGSNGGYTLLLTGTGFPLKTEQATVSICGVEATLLSVSNTQAQIIVPECSTGIEDITISSLGATSNALQFTYNTPSMSGRIYSVYPQSHNPALKGIMNITGVGFGTDQTAIRVDLSNATGKVYPMRILELNDTYIKTGIPGGLAGQFKVQVNLIGIGQILPNSSNVNDFTYELVINSISPTSGSFFGGTLLHIQGINFSPALDQTLVFVGNELNWFCQLQTVNETDITCRTPAASPYYNISRPQTVYLQNRLIVDNTCSGSCQFIYLDQSSSPKLTAMPTNSIVSGQVTLTGTLLNASSPQVVLTNKQTGAVSLVQPTSASSTQLQFTLPAIESGQYNVKVRTVPVGQTNAYLLQVGASLSSTSPASISTQGAKVKLSGTGLPASWPHPDYILQVTRDSVFVEPQILGTSPSAMTIILPAATDGAVFKVALTSPTGKVLTSTITASSSSTPQLSLNSSSLSGPGNNSLVFNKNNLVSASPSYVEVYSLFNPEEVYNISIPSQTATATLALSCVLPGGLFAFRFYYSSYGYANCSSSLPITISQPTLPSPLLSSYKGTSFALSGAGLSPGAKITVNGFSSNLINITSSSAIASIPAFVTTLTQSQYDLTSPQKLNKQQFSIFSDSGNAESVFDGQHGTVYSSSGAVCFVGIDVGSGLRLDLTRIRYFPNSRWMFVANFLIGATFQASNDNSTFDIIATVDSSVHSGWNILQLSLNKPYRYFRFLHNQQSQCQLAELQITGVLLSTNNISSLTSNLATLAYQDGTNSFTYTDAVEFRQDRTPVVSSLSRTTGDVFGGYNLTLNGLNLNFDTPFVSIDRQTCTILDASATQITCNVSSRYDLPTSNTFVVRVGSSQAVVQQTFRYVMRWSDIRTWGTDLPPIDGDLVYVPQGMNLLVDQSTPILEGILVQNGTLTFADESDMNIQAGFITVVGGSFLAGTESNPYQHKLTFTMHGGYYGAQAPIFGNKGIGCLECFFSLHGKIRSVTWTSLESTATVGSSSITVQDAGDWAVGQEIVIASTSFDHYQAERRIITSVNGNTLTLNQSLKYQHFAGIQNYGSDQLEMRAEVGLLTRNIKMMGDSSSQSENYGSHLLIAGSSENGLVGHIAYSEFTDCGQPRIIGRYCIHFHMNGDASTSYVRGNAVHDSMARVITLHGVHFLTVEYNVGHNVQGHNFFVEDGIQTHNLIQYNLAVSSVMTFLMLQTDISVASFWITHPSNHLRYNHAAGSDFYGFWYEIKPHPDGPSATGDVCPMGNTLGESHHNVAHSNIRFGLRIFKLTPRTYPCDPIFEVDEEDPWKNNPAVVGTFSDYTLYKNGECGLLAEQTGNLVFTNIIAAQNRRASAQFYVSEFTKDPVAITNSVLVGQTQSNSPQSMTGSKGLITPRIGNIRIDNIRFYSFSANTHSLETCSNCNDPMAFSNTGQQIYISNITFTNVTGHKLFMNGHKKEVLYDLDGSFTTTHYDGTQRTAAAVTGYFPHLDFQQACLPPSDTSDWDNTLACDSSVKVALVALRSLNPSAIFESVGMKVEPIPDPLYEVPENSISYTETFSIFNRNNDKDSMNDKRTYSLPYIAGRLYQVWWHTGLDFDGLQMTSSPTLTETDPAILFKFNYTLHRQMFDIGASRPTVPLTPARLFYPTPTFLDQYNCSNGEYFQEDNESNRTMQMCASGLNRSTYFETVHVDAIYCRYLCPEPPGEFVKQDFVRYWSNASQWPQGRMPLPGENVTVNGNWTIIMDVDPAPCQFMQIDGEVIIEDKANRNMTCQTIWIRAGSLTAGSSSSPFTHNLTIQLNSLKNDGGYTFDPALQGSKMFVVTGKLNLYGTAPSTLFSRLTATALAGSTTMTVDGLSGWAVGQQLVLSPSFTESNQYERVTITAISSSNKQVTFTPALKYNHYGANSVTISNSVGSLDTRTTVGHVTRNIKFVSGPDNGWGYTIYVYQMWEGLNSRTGMAALSAVQFTLGGQYDTEKSSLNLINNGDNSQGNVLVTKSTFSFCRSYCLNAEFHTGLTLSSNLFYEGRKFHLRLKQVDNLIVQGNRMIGAIFRPTLAASEPVACLQLTQTNPASTSLSITGNICQGSNVNGFVFPFVSCSQLSNIPFSDNTAGSCRASGFLLDRGPTTDTCIGFSGLKAYACSVGQISSAAGTAQLHYSNYIMVDNKVGLSLRFGLSGTDRTATLSDSYFNAISRPDCSECYPATACSGNQAIRMLAVTINGESYPNSYGLSFDGLCKEQVLDAKSYFTNVVFENYRRTYSQIGLASCNNNVLFRPNDNSPDLIGSVYLWDTSCTNCEFQAVGHFDPPKQSELGWFGGCGNMLCTGRNNYILEDYTGTLFPQQGVILANNSWIGDNTPECTYYPSFNGHFCTIHQFAVLQYESIAPDFNTRIMWPVGLTPSGANWTTYTNGYKEWAWAGKEPLNKRIGRFISTIRLFQHYNVTWASNPPDDMRFQLQKRTPGGNNSDWAIFSIYYPFPNMVEIQVQGTTVRPISLLDNNGQDSVDTTVCGSNKFYFYNRTIQFVVTGANNCLVRISLTNSVQLTLHFAMNINDFFSINGQTRLVDRVCALFGILDQSRVKIVGIYTGSTKVYVIINAPVTPESESTTANSTAGLQTIKALKADIDNSAASGAMAADFDLAGLGTLISVGTTLIPMHPQSNQGQTEQSNNQTILIAVLVSVGVGLIVTVLVILWLKKRPNQVAEELPAVSEETIVHESKQEREAVRVQNITEENISQIVFDK